ncbi:MAG TPA: hypothetical protein VGA61_00980, partial [Anaerolineae bacterium]
MSEQSLNQPAGALVGQDAAGTLAAPAAVTHVVRRRRRANPGLWLVYLFLVIMSVFSIFPVFYVIQASLAGAQNLYTTDLRLLPAHATLGNYVYIFQHLPMTNWIVNTFFVTGLATLFGLALSTTGAYALSRYRFRGRQWTLVFLLSLQAFPGLLALIGYFQLLTFLHLTNKLTGLAIVFAAGTVTFGAWNLRGYFDSIPAELE